MNAPDPTHTLSQITRAAIDGAVHIPLTLLRASPTNPRKHFDKQKLEELADSIRKHGLMQPIMVRPVDEPVAGQPLYEIIAGERRWRASTLADTGSIMALVRPMGQLEVLELQLIENLQRDDLHPLEEADGYQQLLRKPDGLQGYATLAELAARIGRSVSYVRQRVQLLRLCPEARAAALAGSLGVRIAIEVSRLASHADQVKALEEIAQGWGGEPMTFLQATAYIQRTFHLTLDKAVFSIADAGLVPGAGSCMVCLKRSGNNPDLFGDSIKSADTCTDPACYSSKVEAHRAMVKQLAEANGKTVITGAAAKKAVPQQYGKLKGLLELDKVHYELGDKPLRKLLGKTPYDTQLLEHPHTQALIEVVAEAEAVNILKALGVLKQARMPGGNEAQRDADRKAKFEAGWRYSAAAECVRAAATSAGAEAAYRQELLTQVALVLWGRLSNDDEKRVERLLGWDHIGSPYADKANAARSEARIRGLLDSELCQLFTACALAGELHVNPNAETGPKRLLRAAEQLGVDALAIRDELRREQLAKVPAKKAAMKIKGPTPETALAAALKNAKPAKVSKVVIKYRSQSTGETWTGRGLMPRWLKVRIEAGGKLDDYLVDKPAAAA